MSLDSFDGISPGRTLRAAPCLDADSLENWMGFLLTVNLALDTLLHIQGLEDHFMTNIWVKSLNVVYL